MGRLKTLIMGLLVTATAFGVPAVARAGSIYVEGYNSALGTLNPTTGVITEIGSTSVKLGGLAFGANGKLYGLGLDENLYLVNTATAALTLIGPCPVDLTPGGGGSLGNASDGTLYAVGTGVVSTVNPNTGALTTLGNLGFTTGADINGDANGNLYIIRNTTESLYSVSPTTGAGTLIGPGTYDTVFGMAFSDGTMYAMQFQGTGIYALNLATGSGTLVSNYDPSIIGSIYTAAAQVQSVPEPSGFVLLGTAGIALISLRVLRFHSQPRERCCS